MQGGCILKLAFITDIHWGARSNSPFFMNNLIQFVDNTFIPYLKEHDINKVIMLGDIFERRKDVNFNVLYHAKKHFFDVLLELDIEVKVI